MIQTSNYDGPWMPPCGVSLGISKYVKTQGHTQNILKGVEMTLGHQIPVNPSGSMAIEKDDHATWLPSNPELKLGRKQMDK